MQYTGVLVIFDAEMTASFPCDQLDIDSDESEVMPNGVGLRVKTNQCGRDLMAKR
jgi:hypothetical protein